MKLDYFDVGSKLILIYGSLNIALAVVMTLLAHLLYPTPFVFVREDELFTGVSWSLILATSPELGLWITYLADTGRGMMIGLGILTTAMALRVLRTGQKWAVVSVLLSGFAAGIPVWTVTALYLSSGLYTGASGVSLGIWLTPLLYVPWAAGLILVAEGRRRNR